MLLSERFIPFNCSRCGGFIFLFHDIKKEHTQNYDELSPIWKKHTCPSILDKKREQAIHSLLVSQTTEGAKLPVRWQQTPYKTAHQEYGVVLQCVSSETQKTSMTLIIAGGSTIKAIYDDPLSLPPGVLLDITHRARISAEEIRLKEIRQIPLLKPQENLGTLKEWYEITLSCPEQSQLENQLDRLLQDLNTHGIPVIGCVPLPVVKEGDKTIHTRQIMVSPKGSMNSVFQKQLMPPNITLSIRQKTASGKET